MDTKSTNGQQHILFNDFQRDMDKEFTKIVHKLPHGLLNYLKSKMLANGFFTKDSCFQLELVVDTNILFAEVRSLMTNNSSFFLKIADNPFIKIYAPSQLREELYAKIKIKFPKDNKTKHLDVNACLIKANLLLSKISIRDDIGNASWHKAKSRLQERDPKDIAFVALNFSLRTHGVLTRDKDISDQKEINTWALADAGEVITEMGKGTFSFGILNVSLPAFWELIYGIITAVWSIFLETIKEMTALFASILAGGVLALAKLPPELVIVAMVVVFLVLMVDDARNKAGELIKVVWLAVKKFIGFIIEIFKAIWETLKAIYEGLKPVFEVSLQLLAYFVLQSGQMLIRLEELESVRPV